MSRVLIFLGLVFTAVLTAAPASANLDSAACAGIDLSVGVPSACLDYMRAFPTPTLSQVRRDGYTINNYSFWKVDSAGAPVFDAPGGNVVREIPSGFHAVQSLDSTSVEGWVQIEDGNWMTASSLKYTPASEFRGVQILDGLQNQFAWALDTMYTSDYPGGPQNADSGRLLYRYDTITLFAEAPDEEGWLWYMVGPDQWVEQRVISKPVKTARPEGVEGRWVSIDLYEQALIAYDGDTPVFATLISSGLPGNDTNEGLFRVWADLPQDRMSGFAGAPNAYDLSGVPWVMYFDDSISLHGTYWHNNFGYRRSRGCVNMSISDARWVFEWAQEGYRQQGIQRVSHEQPGIYVLVWGSGEYRTTGAATK